MNEQEAKRLCALRELVRETFAQTLMIRTDTISDTADFFDELGGDSLDSLDVAVHLEEICGQRVPEEEYALCRCVEDAALLLLRLEQGSAPEAAPEAQVPLLALEVLLEVPGVSGDRQAPLLGRILALFVSESRRGMKDAIRDASAGSWSEVQKFAHKSKSAAASVGAMRMAKNARELDAQLKAGRNAEAVQLLRQCEESFRGYIYSLEREGLLTPGELQVEGSP